jgi:protein-L-isoaspartate(D-aspartate) O-methyltransferase
VTIAARKIRLIMELRRGGIGDTNVLSAIERIPRENFVPLPFQHQSYDNRTLPIGHGQTLSQPQVVALMTQSLQVTRRMKVLEIGTGSGYQAAILSRHCRRIYTIERYRELMRGAESRFAALRLHNITTHIGDGSRGLPAQAPFERIIVTAAADSIPGILVDQLAINGVLILPIARSTRQQELLRLTRTDDGVTEESLGDVKFVPLIEGQLPDTAAEPQKAARSGT